MSIGIGLGRPQASSNSRAASRHPRQSSQAAYSVFDQSQIQTFKECFNLLDTDSDGYITVADLESSITTLGQSPTSHLLSTLLPISGNVPRSINFTHFLTMFAERLSLLDTESDLLEAFACFDDDDSGVVDGDILREWLSGVGDKMSTTEIDKLLSPPFLDSSGLFHYKHFCETLRVTEVDQKEADRVQEEIEGGRSGR